MGGVGGGFFRSPFGGKGRGLYKKRRLINFGKIP
jgi:hypothetical protein